jgi:hypothetical protein
MTLSLRQSRRLHLCPLPLRERATQNFSAEERVRGTPHPPESVESPAMPSPSRGEGATSTVACVESAS